MQLGRVVRLSDLNLVLAWWTDGQLTHLNEVPRLAGAAQVFVCRLPSLLDIQATTFKREHLPSSRHSLQPSAG